MRSEEDEKLKSETLKALMDYSSDDTFYDVSNSNTRSRTDQSLIFGDFSFVSFDRRKKHVYDNMTDVKTESTPINSKNNERSFLGFQPHEHLTIPDSEFFDSETGKQLLMNDQASHERLVMQRTNGCSSWTPYSRKNVSSMSPEFSKFKQKSSVSVGEFVGVFSEPLSFCDFQKMPNIFANCFTSTPNEKRKSRSMSSLLELESANTSNAILSNFNEERSSPWMLSPTSIKLPKFSTPNWAENKLSGDLSIFIGSTARKNIERLRKEERSFQGIDGTSFVDSLEASKTVKEKSNVLGATGSDTTTFALRNSEFTSTTGSLMKSFGDQWYIDPTLVLLDPNKGNRVLLVNNSPKNLKFKTSFDSRIINVCPLSGTVPAMDQIGLRVLVSQYAKKQCENFESDIKIVIGKTEKKIHVKFIKEGKPKFSRERTYMLF